MAELKEFYQNLADQYEYSLAKIKKNAFLVAALRLIVFVLLLACLYLTFKPGTWYYPVCLAAGIAGFLWLISISSRLEQRRQLTANLLFINMNELGILQSKKNAFDDGQSERSSNLYVDDLDVFGDGSLFQLINRTSTHYGKITLAGILKNAFTNPETIILYQKAIQGLAPQNSHRQHIIAGAVNQPYEQNSISGLLAWIQEPPVVSHQLKWKLIRFALPVINLVTLLISLDIGEYYPITITVIISWLAVGSLVKYTQQQNISLGKKQTQLTAYAHILKEFNKIATNSSRLLQEIQHQTTNADQQINKLSRLANLLDQRLNVLVNILLNSFLLYDVQCLFSLEKWKKANKNELAGWIDCVGHVECLVSLATYAFNHEVNSYPTLQGNGICIEAKGVYHPLIPIESNVANDVSIGKPEKLLLITGSNMSGKTTYLRTVGINILMARCGLPVCARSFSFTPLHIHTSIRISDSLQEHTSYFMAELKRLQSIITSLKDNTPSLVLIDEILRGTNSEDKFHGSEAFVEKLIGYNTLCLFATHDLKLSELETRHKGVIANYCFESKIENNKLEFDYKILRGVAKNKNATFLMKQMEII